MNKLHLARVALEYVQSFNVNAISLDNYFYANTDYEADGQPRIDSEQAKASEYFSWCVEQILMNASVPKSIIDSLNKDG